MSLLKEGRRLVTDIGENLGVVRRELPLLQYAHSLFREDKDRLSNFITFMSFLKTMRGFDGVRLGVIAVGSTTRPEYKRNHSPKDIDLRILHSVPEGHMSRRVDVVNLLRSSVRGYLKDHSIDFTEREWAHGYDVVPCPSFTTGNHTGLPLHIIISGVDTPDLETHLAEEGRENKYFVCVYLMSHNLDIKIVEA